MTSHDGSEEVIYQFPRDKGVVNTLGILIITVFLFGVYLIGFITLAPINSNFWLWAILLIIISLLVFILSVFSISRDYRIRIWKDWMLVEGREFDPRTIKWVHYWKIMNSNLPGTHFNFRFIYFDNHGTEQQATIHLGMLSILGDLTDCA